MKRKRTTLPVNPAQSAILMKTRELGEALVHLGHSGKTGSRRSIDRALQILLELKKNFGGHYRVEEMNVFPFLEKHVPKVAALTEILRLEHEYLVERINKLIGQFRSFGNERSRVMKSQMILSMQKRGLYLNYLIQGHIEIEVQNLYGSANQLLKSAEKSELDRYWSCCK